MATTNAKLAELFECLQEIKRRSLFSSHELERCPITASQWIALRIIKEAGEISVSEIAKKLRVTNSAATQLIDALEKIGYIERRESEVDRRSIAISLSSTAGTRFAEIKACVVGHLAELFEILSEEEFDAYLALNKKIAKGLAEKKS